MIKIEKESEGDQIPPSLRIPKQGEAPGTTHIKRLRLIDSGTYIEKFNSRYKTADIKEALNKTYHGKCAFCETWSEEWHVEHYRPKSLYPWLAFSWDNLLVACARCNKFKGNRFEIAGDPARFENKDLDQINQLAAIYAETERPHTIHPELEDPEPFLQFDAKGHIESANSRVAFTIKTCRVDRNAIKDRRRKMLDFFKARLDSAADTATDLEQLKSKLAHELRLFKRQTEDPAVEYVAFRRFILKHMIKDLFAQRVLRPAEDQTR